MKCLNSKIITLLICLQLALFPSVVFASGGLGGWTLSNPIAQGASTVYTGMKNVMINGKNVLKTSSALITPNATQVAKLLGKGVAGVALSFAVEQLLGKVDWVLDPANNQVKYKVPVPDANSGYSTNSVFYPTLKEASETRCKQLVPKGVVFSTTQETTNRWFISCTNADGSGGYGFRVVYVEPTQTEQKTIPLPTVAQQVITNANNGNSDAKVATTATAADIVNDAQNDDTKARPIVNQLEQNATTQADDTTATGQTKPNTETGGMDLSLEFPAFCGWAPLVCEAAQTVINFPTTLEQWYIESKTAIKEAWNWFKEEPTQPEKEQPLDIDQKEITNPSNFDKNYLNFGGSCPSVESTNVQIGPISVPISIDVTALCDFALKVRPAVLGLAYLTALGIVSSAIRES